MDLTKLKFFANSDSPTLEFETRYDFGDEESSFMNKPRSGLWASPIEVDEIGCSTEWMRWCDLNGQKYPPGGFAFTVRESARVLDLDQPEAMETLMEYAREIPFGDSMKPVMCVDWIEVARDYDAICASHDTIREHYFSESGSAIGAGQLSSWIVGSICLFDVSCIDKWDHLPDTRDLHNIENNNHKLTRKAPSISEAAPAESVVDRWKPPKRKKKAETEKAAGSAAAPEGDGKGDEGEGDSTRGAGGAGDGNDNAGSGESRTHDENAPEKGGGRSDGGIDGENAAAEAGTETGQRDEAGESGRSGKTPEAPTEDADGKPLSADGRKRVERVSRAVRSVDKATQSTDRQGRRLKYGEIAERVESAWPEMREAWNGLVEDGETAEKLGVGMEIVRYIDEAEDAVDGFGGGGGPKDGYPLKKFRRAWAKFRKLWKEALRGLKIVREPRGGSRFPGRDAEAIGEPLEVDAVVEDYEQELDMGPY